VPDEVPGVVGVGAAPVAGADPPVAPVVGPIVMPDPGFSPEGPARFPVDWKTTDPPPEAIAGFVLWPLEGVPFGPVET
jgi:hypothetical protein